MDNGQHFKGQANKEKYDNYQIKHSLSTLGYAKSNGQDKASNKKFLNNLKKKLTTHRDLQEDTLSNVLWAYCTMPSMATGESPFILCYGDEDILLTNLLYYTTKTMW